MTSPQRFYTEAEYLAFDEAAEGRHEYVNGEIFAMSGGSAEHSLVSTSVLIALGTAVRGRPCLVFNNDMRLKVDASGMYTYPDVQALCGRPRYLPTRPQTLVNPSVVVEVLSPSTEAYDRGAKFDHYKLVASLREYVLVASEHRYVECYVRRGAEWVYRSFYGADDLVELVSVGVALRVGDLYAQVDALDGPTPEPPRTPRLLREAAPAWGAAE